MIKIVLVLTLQLPGQPESTFRREALSLDDCIIELHRRAERVLAELPPAGVHIASCEITREPLL